MYKYLALINSALSSLAIEKALLTNNEKMSNAVFEGDSNIDEMLLIVGMLVIL